MFKSDKDILLYSYISLQAEELLRPFQVKIKPLHLCLPCSGLSGPLSGWPLRCRQRLQRRAAHRRTAAHPGGAEKSGAAAVHTPEIKGELE
jgi:hypothetical protein